MDIEKILTISASGLEAQRLRMNIIAGNLANAQSTHSPEGGPYRRKDVVFSEILDSMSGKGSGEVQVSGVIEDQRPFQMVYDPQHPDANAEGYVQLPNVNLLEEMVNMMSASRSYEANVTAINSAKSMARKALEIGR
ncbi:MAG TPA: flagellar basal body rod protein FlgC [Nitrospirota bacterium]|nr:flagellar basal body rod protein FlgC [Nitrospirota bacterium]